jgi:hypothetical protein
MLVALVCRVGTQANTQRESELKLGPFPQVTGAELGTPINFENETDTHACFPLIVKGEVISWVHRAHTAPTLVLVQRCVEHDPAIQQTRGSRHGRVNEAWDRVVEGSGGHRPRFVAVNPSAWEHFANPTFCGSLVAYWGTPQNSLVPSIYDLGTGRLVAFRSLGNVEMETDNAYYLPIPAWDATCTKASFDGTRTGKGRVELRVKLSPARRQ